MDKIIEIFQTYSISLLNLYQLRNTDKNNLPKLPANSRMLIQGKYLMPLNAYFYYRKLIYKI